MLDFWIKIYSIIVKITQTFACINIIHSKSILILVCTLHSTSDSRPKIFLSFCYYFTCQHNIKTYEYIPWCYSKYYFAETKIWQLKSFNIKNYCWIGLIYCSFFPCIYVECLYIFQEKCVARSNIEIRITMIVLCKLVYFWIFIFVFSTYICFEVTDSVKLVVCKTFKLLN